MRKLNFRERAIAFWLWAKHRPTVMVNLAGILFIIGGVVGYTIYQQHRSIDVLQDWHISLVPTETRVINGKTVAIYHPNESIVFTSQANKVVDATGTSAREIDCPATPTQAARTIRLDTTPATKAAGQHAQTENAVTLPDVTQYEDENGVSTLPRYCTLDIDISYPDVEGTGRTEAEHAQTQPFLVEVDTLNVAELRAQIDSLSQQIATLQQQLTAAQQAQGNVNVTATVPATPQNTTQSTAPTSDSTVGTTDDTTPTTSTAPAPSFLDTIPVLGGVFKGIGL